MARHIPFKESNKLLGSGGLPNVDDMAIAVSYTEYDIANGHPYVHIVSRWKFTPEELEEVIRTGGVWVETLGVQPIPIAVMGLNPFDNHGYKALDIDQV